MVNRILGGVLLVAGTAVGAGMLAMPVSTGLSGFVPTLVLFLFYWIYMTYTAFLFLEVNLWMGDEDVNLVTMAERTLGWKGKVVAWGFYLFLLYALTTAYTAGGNPLFIGALETIFNVDIPAWIGPLPLLMFFGFFVYRGMRYVDLINRIMMFGLAVSLGVLFFSLFQHVDVGYLEHVEWKALPLAVSLVATSFGFHIIVPSLSRYLKHQVKPLILTLLIGSIIPVTLYILWELVTLGSLPLEGEFGITQGYLEGTSGTHLLKGVLKGSPWAVAACQGLTFFAIITSFLGVSLSLVDFLADGVGIRKTNWGRLFLIMLTFIPPLFLSLMFKRVFFMALEVAGAFGVVVLLGIFPALMVWAGRYHHGFKGPFQVPGGKPALVAVVIFSLLVIIMDSCSQAGCVPV